MKIAYFEPIGGAAGDMLIGSLIDAGGDVDVVKKAVKAVLGDGVEFEVQNVMRGAIKACRVAFRFEAKTKERRLKDVEGLIEGAHLPQTVKQRCAMAFRHLAEAEARVHGKKIEDVVLHETGAEDCIADVVGFFALAEAMQIKLFYCGTVPFGHGYVVCGHGAVPVPPPATVELLKGFAVQFVPEPHEMTTPTAASIIRTVCRPHTPPQMVVERVGYGAGKRERNTTGIPNVLRVTLGSVYVDREPFLWQMEANIDDAEPRILSHAVSKALEMGAQDAWIEPTYGKKGRMGAKLCAIVSQSAMHAVKAVFLEETTTLGVRFWAIRRSVLERFFVEVKTRYGDVVVKVGHDGKRVLNVSVEYESARRLAQSSGVSLKSVVLEGLSAAAAAGIHCGAPVRQPDTSAIRGS
ncbi:MAG: nickel pincer cofactor biosynthesis protein LarC [Planctomycetota bacterium]|nr:MAG: nickel pincer cofactor biosynthesis protein LarC [Planctomycetota bacterium]